MFVAHSGSQPARYLSVVVALLLVTNESAALPNDVYLNGLIIDGRTDQTGFRELMTDIGLTLTPSSLQPAETTGQSGFDFAIDFGVHAIPSQNAYWIRGREVSGRDGRQTFLPTLQTVGVRARKGFIFPLPLTSEVELRSDWLVESRMFNLGAGLRVALLEGFVWLPDVAVSSAINRVLSAGDVNLTTVNFGAGISKGFGVFGNFNLTPFLTYQSIFVQAGSRQIPVAATEVGNLRESGVTSFGPVNMVEFRADSAAQCVALGLTCLRTNRVDRVSFGARMTVVVVQLAAGIDVDILPWRTFPVLVHGGVSAGFSF